MRESHKLFKLQHEKDYMRAKNILLFVLFAVLLFIIGCSSEEAEETTEEGKSATQSDAEEGTPEACGNGICDSVEKEKGLCSADCGGASAPSQETAGSRASSGKSTTSETSDQETTQEEIELSNEEKEELLQTAADAYDEIAAILEELETLVESATDDSLSTTERASLQEEIDALITEINTIAEATESNEVKPLYGTNQETLSATDDYRSAGTPWQRIKDAVNALDQGNQKVEFTYSFIIEGTEMENGESMDLKDYEGNDVSNEEFKQEIREGITAWEALFESVFNTAHGYGGNLEIVFTDLGDETGTSTPSNADVEVYDIPGSENLGDLRYGMEAYDSMVTGTPFSPTGKPEEGSESDSSGDVHYNSNIGWRTDSSSASATSIMIVTAHETGHGLAYQHEDDGLMLPSTIVRGSFHNLFPNNLIEDDAVVAATIAMYGSGASTTSLTLTLEDGTALELPAVNAATLGVSAIKVRTLDETEKAAALVSEAQQMLDDFVQKMESS